METIIQRGNSRKVTFVTNADYQIYLEKLEHYAAKYHDAIHAFVLMTNHVHLLAIPSISNGVSKLMQALGCFYGCIYTSPQACFGKADIN